MPVTTRRMAKLRQAANDRPTPKEQVIALLQDFLRDVEATMMKEIADLAKLSKIAAKLKTMLAKSDAITAESAARIAEMIATPRLA